MDLVKLFSFHFNFFRFFGICIHTPLMSWRVKFFAISSSIFGIVYTTIFPLIVYLVNKPSRGIEIITFTEGIGLFVTHFIVNVETLCTRNQQLNFWVIVDKIEKQYTTKELEGIKRNYVSCRKMFDQKMWILLAISIGIEIILLYILLTHRYSREQVIEDVPTWSVYIFSVMVGKVRHLSHLLVIDILKIHLEIFNNSLVEFKENLKAFDHEALIGKLNSVKFRHTLLWELGRNINDCYQWSQLSNICINFLQFTSICYYIYFHVAIGSYELITPIVILLIPIGSHNFVLMKTSDDLQVEAQKTPHLLQNILHKEKAFLSSLIKSFIVDLSLQMHHERIFISIGKIFIVNLGLLTIIIGTVATYIVIFIQFF
uniref:Gustatory receptor n=1 Tax=Lutzomyia longipalpis TaxID=7200 RepID=A0A240SXP9_LUTLO